MNIDSQQSVSIVNAVLLFFDAFDYGEFASQRDDLVVIQDEAPMREITTVIAM